MLKILTQKIYVRLALFFTFFSYSLGFSLWSTASQISTLLSLKHILDKGSKDLCSVNSLLKNRLEYMSYLFVI